MNLAGFDNGDQAGFWTGASRELPPFFPIIAISNNITFPYTGVAQYAQNPFDIYTLSANYTKLLGKHTLNGGLELRQEEEYFENEPFLDGAFAFVGTATGNPISDFVSGIFAAAPGGFTTDREVSTLSHYGGFFANDIYQASTKLTLTAGVRYELPGSLYEKNDQNAVLLPQLANPLVLVNSGAYSGRGDLQAHHSLFSPRVGFSYAPYPGTTVRAGYSLAFIPQESSSTTAPQFSSLNSPSTFIPAGGHLCAPLGFVTTGTTPGNPCNAAGSVAKTAIFQPISRAAFAANPTLLYGQLIQGREPFSSFPYLQQWNGNVQQAFGSSTILQLAYLGARGQHLPPSTAFDINQLPDNAPIGVQVAGQAAPNAQLERPYPQYQAISATGPFNGDSYYHSAQVTFTKRFTSGGNFLANYSWSKFLSNSESTQSQVESHVEGMIQDYDNLRAERSYLSFDVPHRLVVSYILDLPVGRGRRFLGNASSAVNAAVSGWNVGGINSLQSGFPLAIVANPNLVSAAYGAGTPRPNVIAGCNQKNPISYVTAAQKQTSVINTACFATPVVPTIGAVAANYFGNQPRTSGILRTQGVDNWDFSIGKITPIHDDVNLVFRAEAFNLANRVQFGDPGLTFGLGTFGVLTSQANNPRSLQFSLRVNY